MESFTSLTKGGAPWTPEFVTELKQEDCLGCGRCFKVCGRGVLELMGVTEEGELVDPFDDEAEKKVMSIVSSDNCIGCTACGRTCPKSLYSFTPLVLS